MNEYRTMILTELGLMDIALDQSCRVVELTESILKGEFCVDCRLLELTGS